MSWYRALHDRKNASHSVLLLQNASENTFAESSWSRSLIRATYLVTSLMRPLLAFFMEFTRKREHECSVHRRYVLILVKVSTESGHQSVCQRQ